MKGNKPWLMVAAARRAVARPTGRVVLVLLAAALLDALTGGDALEVVGRVLLGLPSALNSSPFPAAV